MIHVWNRIVDAFYQQTSSNKRLCPAKTPPSRDEIEEYLAFYALNGGLFTVSDKDEVIGIMTVHPGKKEFDKTWCDSKEFTIHMVWSKTKRALHRMMIQGFSRMSPEKVWYCRDGQIRELSNKKVERMFKYGFF